MSDEVNAEVELLNQLRDNPALLNEIASFSGSELALQQRLRSEWDAELVRAAFALSAARKAAGQQLPSAARLWLTRIGLEQATSWEVARHKASRFPEGVTVLDLCSGIGVDTAALLRRGPVTSIDCDPAMSVRCRWNNDIWSQQPDSGDTRSLELNTSDVHDLELNKTTIHLDPDRRVGRDRPALRLEKYSPNLEWMQSTVKSAIGGAIKLGPASNFMQKFPDCEIEIVSLNGECKEATVWFGELAGPGSFRATVLPSGESIAADPMADYCPPSTEIQSFMFDPDPAIVRSGMLDTVANLHNMQRLDNHDEYLTGNDLPDTSFVTAFQVDAIMGNNLRDLKKHLRQNPGVDYEVKCRHVSVDANAVHRKLPRGDGPTRVIFFVRLSGKTRIVVARRIQNTTNRMSSNVDN